MRRARRLQSRLRTQLQSRLLDPLRRSWGLQTLGLRLVMSYTLLFVASTMLLAGLAYVLFTHFMREPDRVFMRAQAFELAAAYEAGGVAALRTTLFGGAPGEELEELLVRVGETAGTDGPGAGEGQTVLLYNPDSWGAAELALLARQPVPERATWVQLGPAADGDPLEAYVLPLSGGRVLQVGMDADLREDAMESIRSAFLAVALPVLLLALLVGAIMAYRALRPVRQLVATFHAVIETGDVQTRVPAEDVGGEFADLAHLFNRMLDRIEALVSGMHGTLDNVAHDLRTPMTRLRGRAELALQEERSADEYREALADGLEASASVLRLLDTIMEVAEAESGTMPLRLEPVAVADLARDVVELYGFVADEKGVALEAALPPGLEVTADRSRMRQVIANLLDNAVKYTPPGGCVAVAAERRAGEVLVRVRDTGVGILPEEVPRIWDRLYRGDRSRSERGLGLGLSLVRAVVEAHGGRVEVESTPGEGSVFTVRLPAAGAGAPPAAGRYAPGDSLTRL